MLKFDWLLTALTYGLIQVQTVQLAVNKNNIKHPSHPKSKKISY